MPNPNLYVPPQIQRSFIQATLPITALPGMWNILTPGYSPGMVNVTLNPDTLSQNFPEAIVTDLNNSGTRSYINLQFSNNAFSGDVNNPDYSQVQTPQLLLSTDSITQQGSVDNLHPIAVATFTDPNNIYFTYMNSAQPLHWTRQ